MIDIYFDMDVYFSLHVIFLNTLIFLSVVSIPFYLIAHQKIPPYLKTIIIIVPLWAIVHPLILLVLAHPEKLKECCGLADNSLTSYYLEWQKRNVTLLTIFLALGLVIGGLSRISRHEKNK